MIRLAKDGHKTHTIVIVKRSNTNHYYPTGTYMITAQQARNQANRIHDKDKKQIVLWSHITQLILDAVKNGLYEVEIYSGIHTDDIKRLNELGYDTSIYPYIRW